MTSTLPSIDHDDTEAPVGQWRRAADPLGLAAHAPLFAAWLDFRAAAISGETRPFTIPGHKQRRELTGELVVGDVPLFGGTDTVQLTRGSLLAAEARAAAYWGGDWARFSVGGSTHGNQALALSIGRPGDRVVVTRGLHRSLMTGLALAGLEPVWVQPGVDDATGLPTAVSVEDVSAALASTDRVCGVFLTDPSYVGTCGPLAEHAEAAHAAGVPLLVDAAWGAHFGAHPDLPEFALRAGADAAVISAHKTLPAMNQAAVVLARTTERSGGLLDPDRLECGFDATHTTSPSGTILASIDASRALLEQHGARLCGDLVRRVARARAQLCSVDGVVAPGADLSSLADRDTGVFAGQLEAAKLVISVAGAGVDGVVLGDQLAAAGLPVEMADRDTLVPIVTIADTDDDVDRLVTEVAAGVERLRRAPRAPQPASAWTARPAVAMSPRDAFFARREPVALDRAVGRVSAELIATYPPGIPVVAPGERVTEQVVAALRATVADGGRLAYAADPAVSTIDVVDLPGQT